MNKITMTAKSDSYKKYVERCQAVGEHPWPKDVYQEQKNELVDHERTFENAVNAGFFMDAARESNRMTLLRQRLHLI